MKILVGVFVLAFCLTLSCASKRDVLPITPPFSPSDRDAADTPLGEACVNLRALGCPEGLPNRRGRTCFENLHDVGALVVIPTDCLRRAPDVEALRLCGDHNTLRVRCTSP